METCSICCDVMPDIVYCGYCRGVACGACTIRHSQQKEEGCCTHCNRTLDSAHVFISSEQVRSYLFIELPAIVLIRGVDDNINHRYMCLLWALRRFDELDHVGTNRLINCPNPHCKGVIMHNTNRCLVCDDHRCHLCGLVRQSGHICDTLIEIDESFARQGTILCPGCENPFIKDGGCNNVHCPHCHQPFRIASKVTEMMQDENMMFRDSFIEGHCPPTTLPMLDMLNFFVYSDEDANEDDPILMSVYARINTQCGYYFLGHIQHDELVALIQYDVTVLQTYMMLDGLKTLLANCFFSSIALLPDKPTQYWQFMNSLINMASQWAPTNYKFQSYLAEVKMFCPI